LSSLDNFYAPSRDTRGEQAFQQGVQSFSGLIDRQAAAAKQERNEGEATQGIADGIREQAGEELQGVRTGNIFRQNSTFYMAGLNETRGKASAAQFKAETAQAYQDWEGRHTDDDGSAFRAWMNDRVGTFMGTLGEDQHRIAGALPIINEVANNYAAQHTGFTSNRLETESFEAYDEIVSGVFMDLANGEFDMEEAVARITNEADDMYETDGAAANNRVVDAAIRYANIHSDPDSILALAHAHDSGAMPLSQQNRERLAEAMDSVEAKIQRNAARDNAAQTAADKAQNENTMNAWATALENDPYAEMPSTADIGSASLRRDMMTFQNAAITSSEVENPQISNQQRILLNADMFDAGTVREKLTVLADFVQANPDGLSGAEYSQMSSDILEQGRPDSMARNTQVKDRRANFGRMVGNLHLGDGYSDAVGSTLSTSAQIAFNEYISTAGATVDTNDPAAMNQMFVDAEAHAMQVLAYQFPTLMGDKVTENPEVARATGADTAVADRQTVVEQEALEAFEALAGGDAEGTPEGTPEAPVTVIDDPDFEDDAETLDPEVIRSQPDSFYQEVMNRFTDGTDDRENVSPSVLIETARRVLDADEDAQNGLITQFLADGGVNLDPSETAWCAGFVNSILQQNGLDGTKSLAARSFLDWGEEVSEPSEGDVVVLSRGRRDGWKGHVGLFQGFDADGNILILGGNQGDGVNITAYPADRLLGYRRPVGTPDSNTADTLLALATRGS
jgi:uncharacterized protein (TIGR02594 family)